MTPNFNPNKWDREKIVDYVIGEQPLTDEQLEFLIYFDKLQQENEKLKKWLEIKNDGFLASIKETCEYATILTEFEKWLEEEIKKLKQSQQKIINLNISDISKSIHIKEFNLRIATNSICLDKLQELKEGKK